MSLPKVIGILCGIFAAVAYGLNPLFALPLTARGISTFGMLFYRFSVAAVLVGCIAPCTGRSLRLSRQELASMSWLSLMMFMSSITLFGSYSYIDAGIASTMLFVYPIMVAMISAGFFREKISCVTGICIVIAFIGVGILCCQGHEQFINPTGCLLVLLSALSYAIYLIGIRHSSANALPPLSISFYTLLGCGIFAGICAIMYGGIDLIKSWEVLGLITGLALLPGFLSLILTAVAVLKAGPVATSILGALEPLTGVFIGCFLFGEALTINLMVGLILILGAVILEIVSEVNRSHRVNSPQ